MLHIQIHPTDLQQLFPYQQLTPPIVLNRPSSDLLHPGSSFEAILSVFKVYYYAKVVFIVVLIVVVPVGM